MLDNALTSVYVLPFVLHLEKARSVRTSSPSLVNVGRRCIRRYIRYPGRDGHSKRHIRLGLNVGGCLVVASEAVHAPFWQLYTITRGDMNRNVAYLRHTAIGCLLEGRGRGWTFVVAKCVLFPTRDCLSSDHGLMRYGRQSGLWMLAEASDIYPYATQIRLT